MLERIVDGKDGAVRFVLECPASACREGGNFPQLRGTENDDIVRCPSCGETFLLETEAPFESPVNPGRFSQHVTLRPTWDSRPVGRWARKVVRHRDGDPHNNAVGNLEVVPATEE